MRRIVIPSVLTSVLASLQPTGLTYCHSPVQQSQPKQNPSLRRSKHSPHSVYPTVRSSLVRQAELGINNRHSCSNEGSPHMLHDAEYLSNAHWLSVPCVCAGISRTIRMCVSVYKSH
ncbi:hypothetical protein K440DRAFT_627915, partial [Wilcoxina mikolae CBS 423.85]